MKTLIVLTLLLLLTGLPTGCATSARKEPPVVIESDGQP
jgi:hypothetical protein